MIFTREEAIAFQGRSSLDKDQYPYRDTNPGDLVWAEFYPGMVAHVPVYGVQQTLERGEWRVRVDWRLKDGNVFLHNETDVQDLSEWETIAVGIYTVVQVNAYWTFYGEDEGCAFTLDKVMRMVSPAPKGFRRRPHKKFATLFQGWGPEKGLDLSAPVRVKR